MKKVYILIICLFLNVSGCGWDSSPEQASWIHGKWLSIGRSENSVKSDKSPAPQYVLFFKRNGKIKRYSVDTGWASTIKGSFKVEDTILKVSAKGESRDLGQLRKDGKLLMNFSRGRYVLYRRLSDNEKVEELNLLEELPIIDIGANQALKHDG